MMKLARFLHSRRVRAVMVAAVVIAGFSWVALDTARACWNTLLIECFDRPAVQWPWNPPGEGSWAVSPPPVHWGIHAADYFDTFFCPDDDQSLWCYGYPPGNDPEFDDYPANYNTYVIFGPFSLANMVGAQVNWSMWSHTEQLFDSVFWGASTTNNLTDAAMKIGGSQWGEFDSWERYSMDLSDLHDFLSGDSVSMVGLPTVYIFWRFRSNSNAIRHVGTFIDNVLLSKDDGLQDVIATTMDVVEPDSDFVDLQYVRMGDSLMAHVGWRICEGSVTDYDTFLVTVTVNDELLFDSTVATGHAGNIVDLYTPVWVVSDTGINTVTLLVDALNEIPENNENNNDSTLTFYVPPPNDPPQFFWVTPSEDTLLVNDIATLRWWASDPQEQATVSIYYDNEPFGCVGVGVPGGLQRPELDGPDSLNWDLSAVPNNRVYYVFARVTDSANDTCIYASYPVVVQHTGVTERPLGGIPDEYYLEQNYPNPFNPATEIRYGIKVPGDVTLRVYDVLGRDVVMLVSDHREPGSYAVRFDGEGLPSGLYMYVLTTPEGTIGRKMMLLK